MNRTVSCLVAAALLAFQAVSAQHRKPEAPWLHDDRGMRSLKTASGTDFEKRFLSQTIEHHRGSIDLSRRSLKASLPEGVRNRAAEIIKRDEHEIRLLKAWLFNWYKIAPLASEEHLVRADMAERMQRPIRTPKDYIDQMIGHEEEEVQMGQLVAKRSLHKQLSEMAAEMVSHSKSDILFFIKSHDVSSK